MFERYTELARRSIFFARYEASMFGSACIEPEHLLLGLLREDPALRELFPLEEARSIVEGRVKTAPKSATSVDMPLSHACKRILAYASEEAERMRRLGVINCLHLALGVLREEKSLAAEILRERGIDREAILAKLTSHPPGEASPSAPALRAIGPLARHLAAVLAVAKPELAVISEAEATGRFEAMGIMIDLALAHQQIFARALVEPRVDSGPLPSPDLTAAQQYNRLPWYELVNLWQALQQLLIHELSLMPEERWCTPCRAGGDADVTLAELVDSYVLRLEVLLRSMLPQ